MAGSLPDWLARRFGASGADDGHGTAWRLLDYWQWPMWATALFVVSAAALIFAAYRHEIGVARRRTRLTLSLMRLGALLLVLVMIARWMLAVEQTDLPTVAVLVDVSRSMDWPDGIESARTTPAAGASPANPPGGAADVDAWTKRLARLKLDRPSRLSVAKALLLDERADLLEELQRRYRVKVYFVADAAEAANHRDDDLVEQLRSVTPHGEQTRLGDALRTALDDLEGRSLAAVIAFTDGVTTDGRTLGEIAPQAARRGAPLFVVAIGSHRPPRDVEMLDVAAEDVAFVGDIVYFDADIAAHSLAGRNLTVSLRRADSNEPLAETTAAVDRDDWRQTVHLSFRPTEPGQFRYIVEARPLADEFNAKNNSASRSLSVVKQQIRVLLVDQQPRYEFRFLKNLLEREPTIELRTVLQEADRDFARTDRMALDTMPVRREDLFRYDVIVLGDTDPALLGPAAMESLRAFVAEHAGSIAFLAGPRFMPYAFAGTPLDAIIPVDLAATRRPDPERLYNEPFALAPTEAGLSLAQMRLAESRDQNAAAWKSLPPLNWFVEAPRLKGGALPLAEHPTARTPSGERLPLVAMLHATWPGKTLFHAIDETYLWRGVEGEKYYARYWVQTIRFLAHTKLLGQDRRAELTSDRRQYRRGMPVELQLRFFAEQDAPTGEQPVNVVIEGAKERRTAALRRLTGRRGWFSAMVNDLEEGDYQARLIAPQVAGVAPAANFSVTPPPGELDRLQVDVADLTAATQSTGGKLYSADSAAQLADDLPPGRAAPTMRLPDVALWNSWPVPIVFLALLVSEWILRKRSGML